MFTLFLCRGFRGGKVGGVVEFVNKYIPPELQSSNQRVLFMGQQGNIDVIYVNLMLHVNTLNFRGAHRLN